MRLEAAQSNMQAQLQLHAQADSYGCCEANKAVVHTKPIKIRFVPRLSSSRVVRRTAITELASVQSLQTMSSSRHTVRNQCDPGWMVAIPSHVI